MNADDVRSVTALDNVCGYRVLASLMGVRWTEEIKEELAIWSGQRRQLDNAVSI
jgi:hypothetical protein